MLTTSSEMVLKIPPVADDVPGSCVERNPGEVEQDARCGEPFATGDRKHSVDHRDPQRREDQPQWEATGGY
jgi:hypothetical protein